MNKLFTLIVTLSFIAVACTPSNVTPTPATPTPTQPKDDDLIACTQEAKQCPDGSYVGRTGPNCEFTACPEIKFQTISTTDIEGLAGPFTFSAEIPIGWEVEAVPSIESINIYDPNSLETSTLDKSQIFIRYFTANSFLTLSTVTIYQQTQTQNKGKPTVIYDIEKKPGVANFPNQPSWRNKRHFVTDIRQTDTDPSVFYVFGQRPDLDEEIFGHFLQTLTLGVRKKTEVVAPIADMRNRITKKSYGTYVTLENSPVQPERFTGYHTGVDVEYEDIENDVEVHAIAPGAVVSSAIATGYGGMLAIKHIIEGEEYLAIYGHLDPNSLVETGTYVTLNQKIGILGDGGTGETDGERKHLHFGLYTGTDLNIKGYVSSKDELTAWADPLSILP